MIKCLVCDLDGTLFLNHRETVFDLEKSNEEAIQKLHSSRINFYVASGRTMHYGIHLLKKYKFDNQIVAGFNGAVINDNGIIVQKHSLRFDEVQSLIQSLEQEYPDFVNIQLQSIKGDRVFYYPDKLNARLYNELSQHQVGQILNINLKNLHEKDFEVAKVSITFETKEKCDLCFKALSAKSNFFLAQSNPTLIEVVEASANKGNFIQYLINKHHFKKEEIACIGDEMNDLEMFAFCGKTFAMKTGNIKVIEQADFVVNSVAECIEYCLQFNNEALLIQ